MAFIYMMITDYSALGASSVVSAADAAGASVVAALFLERRVRVAFLAVAVSIHFKPVIATVLKYHAMLAGFFTQVN